MVLTWRDVAKKNRECCKRSDYSQISYCQFANVSKPCKRAMCKDITVNRSCLTRIEHTEMLSTPRGYTWTGTRGLGFIVDRCKRKHPNDRRRKTKKNNAVICNSATMWQNFAKGFLEIAKDNLAPATKMILTKILTSKTKFSSDPKCCNYTNAQTELCRFLRNITPKCDSNKWKRGFFRTLSSLIFNYIVHVHCSGRLSKKTKLTHIILKKINNITIDDVLFNSPENFSQGVQIFIANMLSPWLEKSITDICKATNNNDPHNKNKQMNEFLQHKLHLDSNGKYKESKNKKKSKTKLSIKKSNMDNTKQKVVNKKNNGNISNVGVNNKNKHLKVKKLLVNNYKNNKTNRSKAVGKLETSIKSYKSNKTIRTNKKKTNKMKSSKIENSKKSVKKSNKNGKKIKTKSITTVEIKDSSFERTNNVNKMTLNTKFKMSNGNKHLKNKLISKLAKSRLNTRGKNFKIISRTKFQSSETKNNKSDIKYKDKMNNNNSNDSNRTKTSKTNKKSNNLNITKRKQPLMTRGRNRSTKDGEDNDKKLIKRNRLNNDGTTNKNRKSKNKNNRSSNKNKLKKRNLLGDSTTTNKNRGPGDKNNNGLWDENEFTKRNLINDDGTETNKNRGPGDKNDNKLRDENELKKQNILNDGTAMNKNRRPGDINDNKLDENNLTKQNFLNDGTATNKNHGPGDKNDNKLRDENELKKQNLLNDDTTMNKNRRPGDINDNRLDENELKKQNLFNDDTTMNKNRRPGDINDNRLDENDLTKQNIFNDGTKTNKNHEPKNTNNNELWDKNELMKRNLDSGTTNKNRGPDDKNGNRLLDKNELTKRNILDNDMTMNKNRNPDNETGNGLWDENQLMKQNLLDDGTTNKNRGPGDKNYSGLWDENKMTKRNLLDDDATMNTNRGLNDNKYGVDGKNNITGVNNLVGGNSDSNDTVGGKEQNTANRHLKINKYTTYEDKLLRDKIERLNEPATYKYNDKIKNNNFNQPEMIGSYILKTSHHKLFPNENINHSKKKRNKDNKIKLNLSNEEEFNLSNEKEFNLSNEKELSLSNEKLLLNQIYDNKNDRFNNNCTALLSNDNGLDNISEDELDCIIKNEMDRFMDELELYCTESSEDIETCFEIDQLQCDHEELNCFMRFANNTKKWFTSFQIYDAKNKVAKAKKPNNNPGIIYQICKKDGSDYSVHKTILPNANISQ